MIAALHKIDRFMNHPTTGLLLLLGYFGFGTGFIILGMSDPALFCVLGFFWELNKAELRELRDQIKKRAWNEGL